PFQIKFERDELRSEKFSGFQYIAKPNGLDCGHATDHVRSFPTFPFGKRETTRARVVLTGEAQQSCASPVRT
ncbi:MAG: hypothetical protein ACKO96_28525, partial [Flammeovirgaceae bacterium]